ncbi:hypothetical protein EDD16DRAFT_1758132 [Pisolithus croceorrhizus]|nr:hypothetical protein EDD16DRAFT_1758132 [Pisolithus croceorrhizus]KAI6122438.1 hypothetical protein EV401DRAFT_1887245 [Pisolithus croceorrhizus]KAI6161279.1 hypothetical protein EDD17DRAFT_1509264 [Pisolithus thermaeus]
MPTFTKARCNSDKENTDVHGPDGPGGRSRRPSEKLRQLTAEQQELAERREIKAQRERKRLQIRQLAQDGSETDKREGFAGDDQYGIDDGNDGNDGSQFTSRVVMTKLSGGCKERLSYSKNKIPRAPPMTIDIDQGEIAASDDEDIESHSTPHSSSDRQSTQHKKSKSRYLGSSTPPEVEDTRDKMAPAMKRHRESSKEDVLETTVVKAQKLVEHEGRPHTRDYDDVTQEFMTTAIGEYRARLCAKAPMPDHIAETSLLDASWVQARKATGVNLDRTPQLAKIVTSRGLQVRGQLKTKLRPLVKAIFGFHSSQSKSAVKKNQSLAEGLKEGMNFAFKHMSADEDGRRGFLKAPLIQKIINTMWFANKHDNGIRFHKHFKPFPYPALALVLMAIECCIDEWTTGIRADIPFTIQEYRGAYDSHLKCLQAFEEATKTHNVLPAICMRLYEVGCIHSGAAPFSALTKVTVSARVVAAAIKEHEEGSTTEDETD